MKIISYAIPFVSGFSIPFLPEEPYSAVIGGAIGFVSFFAYRFALSLEDPA